MRIECSKNIVLRTLVAFVVICVGVILWPQPASAQGVVECFNIVNGRRVVVPCNSGGSSSSTPRRGNGGIFRCLLGGCEDDSDSGPTAAEVEAARQRAAALAAAKAANDRGVAAAKAGDWETAVRLYQEALRHSPNDPVIRDNLNRASATVNNDRGVAAYEKGNYDAAVEYYKLALKTNPTDKVIAGNLSDAQARQAEQQREAQERGRKAGANQTEKTEKLRRQVQETGVAEQRDSRERARLEKEAAEGARWNADAYFRGAFGQAQITKYLGEQAQRQPSGDKGDERAKAAASAGFDQSNPAGAAAGSLMTKNPDKEINTTGWPSEMLSKLDRTPAGRALIDAQVKEQQAIRETNENIARVTKELKTTTDNSTKQKLNQEWADNAQKQAEAKLRSESITKEAKKKVIEVVVELVDTPSASETSKDPLQKEEPPSPAPATQPGQ